MVGCFHLLLKNNPFVDGHWNVIANMLYVLRFSSLPSKFPDPQETQNNCFVFKVNANQKLIINILANIHPKPPSPTH